ncbi:biotin-dependent carboxyltransferase family protein [Rudaeicoccus suwonensis]|uniref:Biotin-dependent carboxylase-like uncharacterized protein n=1 Tax=Rudaeicoccus suwonensis TaxID=657409 RepID=A0A561E6L4_9MICO|nr:biotin-dependent carboxyltransferase family protein [Rudaeicoccus suwonensis]TWE11253.1 biotin-dependent carboxylase-like uncharacterized protein [Rudaeicoccus suwonensis]
MSLQVLRAGPLATIQDLGRPGHGEVGVTPGGAADRAAVIAANRLVGNEISAAGIELLMGGLTVRATSRRLVAVTGAPAEVRVDGRPVAFGAALTMRAGETLSIGVPQVGLRTYLAVRGGVQAPLLYGSAASSPAAGLGPAPLAPGDHLSIGEATNSPQPQAFQPGRWIGDVEVGVILGPRDDWFTHVAIDILTHSAWSATGELDRVGIRLTGPTLQRARFDELLSEGMVRGAIQVPPNGQPLVFLADHPTTGGYPVIAVVRDSDVDRLAQVRPGDRVRFRTS